MVAIANFTPDSHIFGYKMPVTYSIVSRPFSEKKLCCFESLLSHFFTILEL